MVYGGETEAKAIIEARNVIGSDPDLKFNPQKLGLSRE